MSVAEYLLLRVLHHHALAHADRTVAWSEERDKILEEIAHYLVAAVPGGTPRTDAAEHNIGSVTEPHYVVDVEVARRLERELAGAAPVNMRELIGEARRRWWIDSGAQELFDRDIFRALTPVGKP